MNSFAAMRGCVLLCLVLACLVALTTGYHRPLYRPHHRPHRRPPHHIPRPGPPTPRTCFHSGAVAGANRLFGGRYTHIHTYTFTHSHIHTFTHSHIHTFTHSHIHTFTHSHIHTCAHTHTHKHYARLRSPVSDAGVSDGIDHWLLSALSTTLPSTP